MFKGVAPGSLGSAFGSMPGGNWVGYEGSLGPQGQSSGGGNPAAGILADYLSKMRADTNAASVFDAASRDAALRRLVISYGQVPDFSALGIDKNTSDILKKALDSNTIEQARKNTEQGTSAYARMFHGNELANRRIPAQLAGRGLLRSGQTVSDLSEQAQGYKNEQFDALNAILGQATGAIGAFAAAERQRQEQLAQMELQAALAAAAEGYGSSQQQQSSGAGAPPPSNPTSMALAAIGYPSAYVNIRRKSRYDQGMGGY
jgi:hypothetical protein